MTIHIAKFGSVLASRQSGREAYAAFLPTINAIPSGEEVVLDFEGVSAFSPSWGDEFLTPLQRMFGDRLLLTHVQNPSVSLTLTMLEQINALPFHKR